MAKQGRRIGKTRLSRKSLAQTMAQAFGLVPKDEAEAVPAAPPETSRLQPNRTDLRRMGRTAKGADAPHARIGKVGHRDHWRSVDDRRRDIKRSLQAVRTASLIPECKPLELLAESHSDVWTLSQASYADLIKTPGVGPAKLRTIKKYLAAQAVWTAWKVEG